MDTNGKQTLTPRQQEVYDFISARIRDGLPPTVREIAAECGISSPNGVICHLRALERKGWITCDDHRSRGIHLTDDPTAELRRVAESLFELCNKWGLLTACEIDEYAEIIGVDSETAGL